MLTEAHDTVDDLTFSQMMDYISEVDRLCVMFLNGSQCYSSSGIAILHLALLFFILILSGEE